MRLIESPVKMTYSLMLGIFQSLICSSKTAALNQRLHNVGNVMHDMGIVVLPKRFIKGVKSGIVNATSNTTARSIVRMITRFTQKTAIF